MSPLLARKGCERLQETETSLEKAGGVKLLYFPLVWMPNLNQIVLHLLEENLRYVLHRYAMKMHIRLMYSALDGSITWHDGIIPDTEIRVKLGVKILKINIQASHHVNTQLSS